jgi:KTSC domain
MQPIGPRPGSDVHPSVAARDRGSATVEVVTRWGLERKPVQGVSPAKGGSLNMNRTTVGSPGIAQVGYEEGSETLEIEFVSGKIFQFYNVPLKLFNQLMNSSQKELYYESHILVRFPYTRIF